MLDLDLWEARCEAFLRQTAPADAAHDLDHVRRVVASARQLAEAEGADLRVVLPAAWLHDCVVLPKDSPDRAQASRLAAERAVTFLREAGYPEAHLDAVAHAVEAHSFSAGIAPRTLEAQVVQDADRLDALGAIGLARTLAVGQHHGAALYHPGEPVPETRPLDDQRYVLDHFYAKLFTLEGTMQTEAARQEAARRTAFLRRYVEELLREVG